MKKLKPRKVKATGRRGRKVKKHKFKKLKVITNISVKFIGNCHN